MFLAMSKVRKKKKTKQKETKKKKQKVFFFLLKSVPSLSCLYEMLSLFLLWHQFSSAAEFKY